MTYKVRMCSILRER